MNARTLLAVLVPVLVLAATPVLVDREVRTVDAFHFRSPDGNRLAVVEYTMGNTEFVPFSRVEVRDADGNVVYVLSESGHTVLDLADNGAMVGIDFDGPVSGHAALHFYSPEGRRLGSAEVGFMNDRMFSKDSRYYIVNDGRRGVLLFLADGKLLHELGTGNLSAVSPDGGEAAVARDEAIVRFREGREVQRIALASPFVREMRFAGDGRFGFVDRFEARAYSEDGSLMFTWPAEAGYRLVSFDFVPGAEHMLVGAHYDPGRDAPKLSPRGAVFMLDGSGEVTGRLDLTYETWNAFTPAVRAGDRTFTVTTAREVSVYRWEEE